MTKPATTAARLARLLLAIGALGLGGAGLAALGRRRWTKVARSLTGALEAAGADVPNDPPRVTHYHPRELVGLPEPVERFFRAVLTDGQPMVRRVDVRMAGRINLSTGGERWKPFTARQTIVAQRPGFVWDARVALLPGVALRVIDAYVAGEGRLAVAALGLVPLASLRGTGDTARAELIRWFAELAWLPTALLPSQGVRWEGVDPRTARATLVDGPLSVSLLFRFDASGPIESVHADARAASLGGQVVVMPWEGRWAGHEDHHGMRVPMDAEAVWPQRDGGRPYFVGSVTSIEHGFDDALTR